jgi:1,4-dihydroxy-6-naphthoate synthase
MSVLTKEITLAHSPDSDDAFMMYAIAEGKMDTKGINFRITAKDIQTLNNEALARTYDVSAISFAAYPSIAKDYILTTCGGSFGDNYGPILIGKREFSQSELSKIRIAIPGKLTTAYLTLRLFQPELNVAEHPFQDIISAVASGEFDAGLLIHEGQLTYKELDLKKIVDLGQWWHEKTGLPLPLGGNVIRRSLGPELIRETVAFLKESISYSLKHRSEGLQYAMGFARDMPSDMIDRYVSMYVNELTVDCGSKGCDAVRLLFSEAYEKGILAEPVQVEFA